MGQRVVSDVNWSHRTVFSAEPGSVPEVRAFVGSLLLDHAGSHLVEDLQLVASELATNALLYAGAPFTVSLEQNGSSIRLTVSDGSPTVPRMRAPSTLATSGRGLSIVASLSQEWGVRLGPGGAKSVWASFAA